MKKLILAVLFSVSVIGAANAFFGFGGGCCPTACPQPSCQPSYQASYQPACQPASEEPVPPICTKTIMVPQTIQVPKVVQVPARKILIPQADIIERIPQAPRQICVKQPPLPQPDIIKYVCVPDKVVCRKQQPLVRYECPIGTNEAGPAGAGCPCP